VENPEISPVDQLAGNSQNGSVNASEILLHLFFPKTTPAKSLIWQQCGQAGERIQIFRKSLKERQAQQTGVRILLPFKWAALVIGIES
jgi:hypothetical protein